MLVGPRRSLQNQKVMDKKHYNTDKSKDMTNTTRKLGPDHYRMVYNFICNDNLSIDLQLSYIRYVVIKETPCGYWLMTHYGGNKRWVSKTSLKRFAYPTKEEAFNSFKIRNSRRIGYLVRETKIRKKIKKKLNRSEPQDFQLL